jgi:hypothetical protein
MRKAGGRSGGQHVQGERRQRRCGGRFGLLGWHPSQCENPSWRVSETRSVRVCECLFNVQIQLRRDHDDGPDSSSLRE